MYMQNQPQESSLWIYHEKIAEQLSAIFGNIEGVNKDNARHLIICNIVYARSLSEGVERKDDMATAAYLKKLQQTTDVYILIAEMVYWQKQAKLTPQILNLFAQSTYAKALDKAKKDAAAEAASIIK